MKRHVSVSGILKNLGVSRSGYHVWGNRIPSDAENYRNIIKEKIQDIYDTSHQNYGAPKITVELKNRVNISLKEPLEIICDRWE